MQWKQEQEIPGACKIEKMIQNIKQQKRHAEIIIVMMVLITNIIQNFVHNHWKVEEWEGKNRHEHGVKYHKTQIEDSV